MKKKLIDFLLRLKYWSRDGDGYALEKYWANRLRTFGIDSLRGVGKRSLSEEENREMYSDAKEILLDICFQAGVDFKEMSILDVGCGTGYYAQIVLEKNINSRYVGIDITDVLLGELRERFPHFQFQKSDITTKELEEDFDLIIMIDITQHIVNDDKFSFAMKNVKTHLRKGGIFIVTSWLNDQKIRSRFYEIKRPLELYEKEFPEGSYKISEPVPFRDKFLLVIKKK